VRVEFWPSTRHDLGDEAYFALDLDVEVADLILDLTGGVVTQWSRSFRAGDSLRFRIRSPAMFITLCQNQQRAHPELRQILGFLRKGHDLQWEIRIPTGSWDIPSRDETPDWWEVEGEKEEVPA
jgi:hypothetical protein